MTPDQPLSIVVDGQEVDLGLASAEPLVRAVVVSLFTWRRANPDDSLPGDEVMGWWGDSYAELPGDRIGSRLWLLSRSALTDQVVREAKEYAVEALQWLIDDGVATDVAVTAVRAGISMLVLTCLITRADSGELLDLRFADAWRFLKNAV